MKLLNDGSISHDPSPSVPDGWREVSQGEFYRVIGPQNVHPQPVGDYPYTSLFKTPHGEIKGRAVGYQPEGHGLPSTQYLLPNP